MKTAIALSFDFDFDPAPLPFCGHTPAAQHASWTGAQAGAAMRGEYLELLLSKFTRYRSLTFAEFCKLVSKEQHTMCSTWAAAKELNWIKGTDKFHSYTFKGRLVHREIHSITPTGRQVAFEKLRASVERIEARS